MNRTCERTKIAKQTKTQRIIPQMRTSCSESECSPLCLCLLLPHSEEFGQKQNNFDILHPKLWGRVTWEGRAKCACCQTGRIKNVLGGLWTFRLLFVPFGWFPPMKSSAISEECDWEWQDREFSRLSSTRKDLTMDDRQNQTSLQFITTKLKLFSSSNTLS